MRRIQEFKLDIGIFKDVIKLLSFKVETMDIADKLCVLSYDDMKISKQQDGAKRFLGYLRVLIHCLMPTFRELCSSSG